MRSYWAKFCDFKNLLWEKKDVHAQINVYNNFGRSRSTRWEKVFLLSFYVFYLKNYCYHIFISYIYIIYLKAGFISCWISVFVYTVSTFLHRCFQNHLLQNFCMLQTVKSSCTYNKSATDDFENIYADASTCGKEYIKQIQMGWL